MTPPTDMQRAIENSLAMLKDFQKATVDVVYDQLFYQGQNRMLVADEVGLGKTIVAKGIIARRLKEKLAQQDDTPLRVTYICSNQIIGQENIGKLAVSPQQYSYDRSVDRLAFLAFKPQYDLSSQLHLNTLTPGTSFHSSNHAGDQRERILLYSLLMQDKEMLVGIPNELSCLLRGSVQREPKDWAEHLEDCRKNKYSPDKLQDNLPVKFLGTIQQTSNQQPSLYEEILYLACELTFENYKQYTRESLKIIRQLRKVLATLCVDYINADLYILDEFQRFRDLIDQDSQTEAAVIAKQIFANPNAKILLLSATPFKAFTGESESELGEDHYKEFRTVLSFLVRNDQQWLCEYESNRQALFKQLLQLEDDNVAINSSHRNAVESLLRQVMVRTERLSVSEDQNAMTFDKWQNHPVPITPGDIGNFVATDNVVQHLNRITNNKSSTLPPPIEFCKSAPFPLSFLDDYQLKKSLRTHKANQGMQDCLQHNRSAWLDHQKIHNYSLAIGAATRAYSSVANSRLTQLVDEALSGGAEMLLWVPPSLPYYPLSGPFANADGFSKTLIFSSWLMVPRMLATLLSYEVERRMTESQDLYRTHKGELDEQALDERVRHEQEGHEPYTYFNAAGSRRHPVPPLVYGTDRNGAPANMNNITLLFPSIALASLYQPTKASVPVTDAEMLRAQLKSKCQALLELPELTQLQDSSGVSERWYWAAPLLLDKLNHQETLRQWLGDDRLHQTSFWKDGDPQATESLDEILQDIETQETTVHKTVKESSKSQHFDHLRRSLQSPEGIGLGPMPPDLPDVLADMAMGSPAICSFRSLQNLFQIDAVTACISSFSLANEFINLFNKPEAIMATRLSIPEQVPYWQKALRYCRAGCLQAVLDEYLHLTKADIQNAKEPAEKAMSLLGDSINLKTTSIKVDDLDSFLNEERKSMRCHFAVDLGNQRSETSEGSKRITSLRQNFNSPFRPFVLATTSIGQEGLDFHQYCRKVVHWNLPSNPIDLEQREGRVNRFKGLVIRQQIAHKYGPLLSPQDLQSSDIWDNLFTAAAQMEQEGTAKCELVPYWHVETQGFEKYRIERIVPFYPFSRDGAKLSAILRTLALYRLAFGQPRQAELMAHLLKHIPEDKIPEIRKKLMIDLSPINYQTKVENKA